MPEAEWRGRRSFPLPRRAPRLPVLFLVLAGCGGGGGGTAPEGPPAGDGLAIGTVALPAARVGQPYAATVAATGGSGVGRAWRIVEGSLPAGLTLEGGPECITWGAAQTTGAIGPGPGGERREVSGLAASRRNPGVLWAHDDSGGAPLLHALGEDGALRQTYRLDVQPTDWEDLALGPGDAPGEEVLWVADTGDNGTSRAYVVLLRATEPAVPEVPGPEVALPHRAYALRYPDGAHDVEALAVDWETGTPYLLGKSDAGGDAWRVPLPLDPDWSPTTPGTFVPVSSGAPLPSQVTAADAGRDANRLVLRTYFQGFEYLRPPGQPFEALFAAVPCTFGIPLVGQYEAFALTPKGDGWFTTTELVLGEAAPLHRADAVPAPTPAILSGTPTEAGQAAFVLEVREASGVRATRAFVLTVR